jgi:hypothetical protein
MVLSARTHGLIAPGFERLHNKLQSGKGNNMNSNSTWAAAERETDRQRAHELSDAGQRQHFIQKARQNKPVQKPAQRPVLKPVAAAAAMKDTIPPPAFNFYLYPASQKAAVLVDRVTNSWLKSGHVFRRPIKAEVLQNYKKIIETVTLNVLWALLHNIAAVRIRREEALYRKKSRYRPDIFDKKILTVLDDLHEMNVLKQVKGDRWTTGLEVTSNGSIQHGNGVDHDREYKQTRLFAGQVVKELQKLLHIESVLEVGEAFDQQEIIVLKKDETSSLAEYEDSADTEKLREQMRRINLMLAEAGPLLATEIKGMSSFTYLDERERHLVRRFTYGSFASGGRLWGGFWMNMKKELRPRVLRIHGEKTVECDYSGILPRLAYLVLGKGKAEVPAGDVYNIPGLSTESRAGIKILFNALLMEIRTKPRDRFPQGMSEKLAPEDRVKGYKKVYELIASQHALLVPSFGTGLGHYLQFLESTLLVNVLLDLGQKHIVALPIHDGVIVQERKAEMVCAVMEHQALSVLRWGIPVSVKGSPVMVEGRGKDHETVRRAV